MAKITDFQAITLSSLSNEDVFHMVDLSGDSIIGSRKLSYEVLKQGIDRDIEKVQVIKGCSYNKDTKTIELSVGLSDGGTKVLSISMEELNIYHAEDGLSTKVGDDNTFVVDWDKVARREHRHEISDVNELDENLEDIQESFDDVYKELSEKALSVHKHLESDITDFGSYLSVNSLVGISDDWTYEHSKNTLSNEGYEVISRLGTLAYKNEISASEVCGYEDTKYTAGDGLKLEGTEFSISTDYIKRAETDGKLALCSFSDLNLKELAHKDESEISSHYLPSGNSYLTSNALDGLSGNWNTAWSRVSALSHDISGDIGSIGYKNSLELSDVNDLNDELSRRSLTGHTHITNDITDISNYVRNDEYTIRIGNGSTSSNRSNIVIGSGSTKAEDLESIAIGKNTTAKKNYSIAIGSSSISKGTKSIAIGSSSKVDTDVDFACQIGQGTNNQVSSLQFLNTQIVNSNGVIPNKSLELSSVNGILSGDGKGNIIGTEEYVHPTYIDKELGLYKISVDNGHVGGVVSVSKEDITSLGIPGQDTSCYVEDGRGLKISNNVISIDYSELCSEIDLSAYSKTDTKYYAGRGLSIDTTTNTFSTSAEYTTYDYVTKNLSNNGYSLKVTFREWD